ncbi:hypothetical protein [Micromonospora sp. NPDC047527]|uniref:hypothetical protein n=1 Tax=Micromonospora sp. NPDC047527 TaxID=3155144 RepID=UPI003411CD34
MAEEPVPKPTLAAVAALHEMAGWMAHDSGADSLARKHLGDALRFARASGDTHIGAQVRASLSHLASHRGDAVAAISHAREGLGLLQTGPPHGRLTARLLALHARGLVSTGKALEAHDALTAAEAVLGAESGHTPAWLSPFDTTSFAIEAARCFLRMGDLDETQARLREVLTDPPGRRVRSRAFAQLLLATALIGKGQIEEACALTHEALDETAGLGSLVVVDHLRHVAVLLRPRGATVVEAPPLLDRLQCAIRERAWIGVPAP